MNTALPLLLTREHLEPAYGRRCRVEGRYEIMPFENKKGRVFVHWPVVVLNDGTSILLNSFWQHKNGRSADERTELVGRRVQVEGVLHREPPTDAYSQNVAIPTVSPVEIVWSDLPE